MENIRVGVAAMGQGAGASFVTMCLAGELADMYGLSYLNEAGDDGGAITGVVTVAASDDTFFYDSLGFEKRFSKGTFIPFEEYDQETAQELQRSGTLPNLSENISWLVSSPKTGIQRISDRERARILARIRSRYILWDMGHKAVKADFDENIKDVDVLVYVVDPLPSRMLPMYECFERVRDCDIPVIYVINKSNGGVDRRDLLSFLKIKKPVYLPWADPALIYRSEYRCEYIYSSSEIRSLMQPSVRKIANIIEDIRRRK